MGACIAVTRASTSSGDAASHLLKQCTGDITKNSLPVCIGTTGVRPGISAHAQQCTASRVTLFACSALLFAWSALLFVLVGKQPMHVQVCVYSSSTTTHACNA